MDDAKLKEELDHLRGAVLANDLVLQAFILSLNASGHLPRDTWVSAVNFALEAVERMQATSPSEGFEFFDTARKHVEEFLPSIEPSKP